MRRNALILAALAAIAVLATASAPAYADPGNGNGAPQQSGPPGNNGTIKVHAGDTENEPLMANEPHPGCTFHIHGFNFDPSSTGSWSIVAWAPTGDGQTVVSSGSWSANASGDWRTAVMTLAPGHYKVFAKQSGTPGGEKQKVFWVECGGTVAGATATPTPTSTPTATPTSTATATPTATTSAGGVVVGSATPTPTPVPTQLGFEQGPHGPMGGVTPIIETGPGAPAQAPVAQAPAVQAPAAPGAVAGVQQPGSAPITVSGLPSTSTVPLGGSLGVFSALAVLAWRRLRH